MSLDIGVHLWFGDAAHIDALEVFRRALECVAVPQHKDSDGTIFKRFCRVKVYEQSWSEVRLDEELDTNDVAAVIEKLRGFVGHKFRYEVKSVFDHIAYDDYHKNLEPTIHPLSIEYFGSEYGWNGLEYKSYGSIRFDFSNTKVFQVPQALIEQIRAVANRRGDTTRWLQMPPQIGHNFEAVSGLAKRLISALNPVHLLVCTDQEVNPLTSHAIYHRDIQDYVRDLEKIARLHEYGGVYFCDVAPDEPAFITARKSPPDYGYLRNHYAAGTEEQFAEILQPMVNVILSNPEMLNLSVNESVNEIEACFKSLDSTEVERLNNSYYLSVSDAAFAYLEEPYFRLCEAIYGSVNTHETRNMAN